MSAPRTHLEKAPPPEGLNGAAPTDTQCGLPQHPKVLELIEANKHLPPLEELINQGGCQNKASLHVSDLMQRETARVNAQLIDDCLPLLKGQCIYLNNFLCRMRDLTLFDLMKEEVIMSLQGSKDRADVDLTEGLVAWSKHKVFENPTCVSILFNKIVQFVSDYFDLEIYATRLNYYADGNDWKPYHHDSHAYGGKALREDFTAGLTLGPAIRALNFLHEESKTVFGFPQRNGDCFAFTNEVNTKFKHGVPKASRVDCGDRMSIIAWGRRRTINERNGGVVKISRPMKQLADDSTTDCGEEEGGLKTVEDAISAAHQLVSLTVTENRSMVERKPKDKKKKNRLQ